MTSQEESMIAGEMIRRALRHFWKRPCKKRYVGAMQVLRDNFIWMTGEMRIQDEDVEKIRNLHEGDVFTPRSDVEFSPSAVTNGKEEYLAVFSSLDQMQGNIHGDVNVEKHIFEAMTCAMKHDEWAGIVVDPFGEKFRIPKQDFDLLGNLPSKYHGLNPQSMDEMSINESFAGMLWGLVIGDCLGSPIQFTGKDDHPYIDKMIPCERFHTPAGYWTDDASMAFCIMESFVRLKKYDLPDIGHNFSRWYRQGFCSSLPYAFDVGAATSYAIAEIEKGSLANGLETSQGNGSIMRFAPSYIMNYGKPDDKIITAISDLTHQSGEVRHVVDRMKRICDDHVKGQRTKITSPYKKREEVNNSGWAVSTLDAALWAFHTTSNFEDGMLAAVNLGGDADSIGAVYGQIAGAYYGLAGIPPRWLMAVKDWKKVQALIGSFINQKHELDSPCWKKQNNM